MLDTGFWLRPEWQAWGAAMTIGERGMRDYIPLMGEPKLKIGAPPITPDGKGLSEALLADEDKLVSALIEQARFSEEEQREIARLAGRLVQAARAGRRESGGVDSFLNEYGLSSREGVLLLCLAEALLRIPDAATADRLISRHRWQRRLGATSRPFKLAPRQRLDLWPDADRTRHRLGH